MLMAARYIALDISTSEGGKALCRSVRNGGKMAVDRPALWDKIPRYLR
jgi:hypothetical protein